MVSAERMLMYCMLSGQIMDNLAIRLATRCLNPLPPRCPPLLPLHPRAWLKHAFSECGAPSLNRTTTRVKTICGRFGLPPLILFMAREFGWSSVKSAALLGAFFPGCERF